MQHHDNSGGVGGTNNNIETNTHLLTVLGDNGLYSYHVGGLHHEGDRLALSDLHHTLEHHGVVVAR